MAIKDNPAVMGKAVSNLITALLAEKGDRRTASCEVVSGQAVLTEDLKAIAAATQAHLNHFAQATHELYLWKIVYQPDGSVFIATAPE
jgi:hypothetical protein